MLPNWRYKRFHISYVLAWAATGLLVGLFAGQFLQLPFAWVLACIAVLILVGTCRSRRVMACGLAVIAGCLLGLARGGLYTHQLALLGAYEGKTVTIQGTISQDPTLQNGSDIWQVQLNRIRIEKQDYVGEVYATVVTEQALRRGDSVVLQAKAGKGFGSFQLTLYRA